MQCTCILFIHANDMFILFILLTDFVDDGLAIPGKMAYFTASKCITFLFVSLSSCEWYI